MKKLLLFLAIITLTISANAQYLIIKAKILDVNGVQYSSVVLKPEITLDGEIIVCRNTFYPDEQCLSEIHPMINDNLFRLPYYPTTYFCNTESGLSIVEQALYGLKADLLYLNPKWKNTDILIIN